MSETPTYANAERHAFGDPKVPSFVNDAIQEIDRLTKFGRMVDLGFTLGKDLSTITNLFQHRLKGDHGANEGLETLRSLGAELAPYAAAELANDLAYLKSVLTIQYVTILETVVQDAVLFSLEHAPSVQNRDAIKRIEGPIVELLAASPSERAEFLAAALAHNMKASLKPGVGKFEALLDAVGLGGAIDEPVRRVLLELTAVRNVLVHRRRRADRRFCEGCPWLKFKPGDEVKVSTAMATRYRSATLYYLIEIILRWSRRDAVVIDTQRFETMKKAVIEKLLAEDAG